MLKVTTSLTVAHARLGLSAQLTQEVSEPPLAHLSTKDITHTTGSNLKIKQALTPQSKQQKTEANLLAKLDVNVPLGFVE